jgi:hypothetical protein
MSLGDTSAMTLEQFHKWKSELDLQTVAHTVTAQQSLILDMDKRIKLLEAELQAHTNNFSAHEL